MKKQFKNNQEYLLKQDLVIPAGTRFENWSNRQKEQEVFECVWGDQVHDDFASYFKIPYDAMEEILELNPEFFKKI